MIAIAARLNGAVTVSELLSSSALLRAAMRVLARADGGAEAEAGDVPLSEDDLMRERLLNYSVVAED